MENNCRQKKTIEMIYAFFSKFSKQVLEHHPELITTIIKKDANRNRIKMINKGMVLKDFSRIEISDCNGDDFAHNLITAFIHCNCYRIPRFLKKSLLKNFKLI